jgi:surface polysaccharide O-acyltransferase-like enzyme
MRLVSFDYLRGIAILFIVAGHSYGAWSIDTFSEKVIANIVSGGTALFVFISGFFFHHTFYENFNLNVFMSKKVNYVLVPYLIFSVLGISYYAISTEPFPYLSQMTSHAVSSWYDYFQLCLSYLWTGRITVGYWYIPFIMIVFLLSPLFILYIKLSIVVRAIIFLICLFIVSLFIHRPAFNLSPLHSVLYFVPLYILGINCSINREQFDDFIRGKALIFGLTVILLSVLQAAYFNVTGNFHKEELFSYGGLDIIIFQKIALCLFLITALQHSEDKTIPSLKLLASASFAIYFLHPWVLDVMAKVQIYRLLSDLPEIAAWLVTFLLTVTISLTIAFLVKTILKNNSRSIIGW